MLKWYRLLCQCQHHCMKDNNNKAFSQGSSNKKIQDEELLEIAVPVVAEKLTLLLIQNVSDWMEVERVSMTARLRGKTSLPFFVLPIQGTTKLFLTVNAKPQTFPAVSVYIVKK